ncbi:MAG TPA: metal ABC transporter permease, partial [Bacillota bacterium]|nr:metal ABC transporter permease [Bacillota bacterium]
MAIGVVMRLVGALLVDAIILLPALGALQIGTSLASVLAVTSLLGLITTVMGLVFALFFNWPLGVTITLTGVVVLLSITVWRKLSENVKRR